MGKKVLGMFAALSLAFGALVPALSLAAYSVSPGPASLVTNPLLVKASSVPIGLFEFTASSNAAETLSSVSVLVGQNATTTVSGSDLANVALYKDDGNGSFNSAEDTLVGTQAVVNIGSSTQITAATSTAFSGKFFVSLQTGASWSDAAPADSIVVTLPANSIETSAGLASTSAVATASITADITAPLLISAMAKNTGGTDNKEAGDSVELTFSEPTNKPAINSGNLATYFSLNNGHSFLDLNGNTGAITWNEAGTMLIITLSGTTTPTSTLASVVTGDVVTVVSNSGFTDLAGNMAVGTQSISGSFAGALPGGGGGEEVRGNCANGLVNGKLYKIGSEPTVYLAAACRLKPFRGAAVFHARGQKFQDIITLPSAPANVSVNLNDPVLPTAGTLVKGSDNTVWFIDKNGKRRGFVSGKHFMELGFEFKKVKQISDSDLQFMPVGSPIENNEDHPDGTILKCGNSGTVFQIIGNNKFPFASEQAFVGRGNSFEHVLTVDCGRFKYVQGAAINQ